MLTALENRHTGALKSIVGICCDHIIDALEKYAIVAVTDVAGRIIYVNDRFCEISQFSREELMGQDHRIVNSGYHPKEFWRHMWKVIGHGDVFRAEVRNRAKDGTFYWVDAAIIPLVNGEGKPTCYVAIRVDITERKKLEEELIHAREAAEDASRLKSQFLANMSHEIRTPMNGILGMTSLLLDTPLSAEQREHATLVRTSGESLLAIINDILDFSKIEAGRMEFEHTAFDFRETVDAVLTLLAERAHPKGLELTALIEPEVPEMVAGDPGRLRQILVNLVGNAVKFTARGEVVVRARVEGEAEGYVRVRVEVSDSGIGISAEGRKQIFQPFRQADGSMTRRFGGTGLGLAITRQLVELMGGEIGVFSQPGQGSTFWFTARLERKPSPECPVGPRAELVQVRALCVDDNATNCYFLQQQLARWGMACDAVTSAREAMARMWEARREGRSYGIVFIDLMMPEVSGMDLARWIKKEAELAKTPLVLLASVFERGQRAAGQAAGFAATLGKPLRQTELFRCIEAVLLPGRVRMRDVHREQMSVGSIGLSGAEVLVAEDNPVNQRLASTMLERLGCRPHVVGSGQAALAALSRRRFSLVLMDVQMPDMDGFEATRLIRAAEGTSRHIPIIAVTANALSGDRERCLAAGMDDYLSKPFRKEDLVRVLSRWCTEE